MSNSVDYKKSVALEFLRLTAKTFSEAADHEEFIFQSKLRLYYLKLALANNCSPDEIRLALNISGQTFTELVSH